MTLPATLLDAHTQSVLEAVVAEENSRRAHLVIALSGAHAYGFPSPDSDLDLKSIHIEPSARLLGLTTPPAHADRMEIVEGVEIDYTSNELKPALLGVLHGNGNYIERVLGALQPHASTDLASLKPLVRATLSRRIAAHYLGFAKSQRDAFAKDTTAKKLLYVLRTALTGAHALRTGEIVTDLSDLCEPLGFPGARDLIATKRKGERVKLEGAEVTHWEAEADRAIALLRAAHEPSVLPREVPEAAARDLEAWLLDVRRRI